MYSTAINLLVCTLLAPASPTTKGEITFAADGADVPERYRLPAHTFTYQRAPEYDLTYSGVAVDTLKFPSPVTSPDVENNTVYCEYFRPKKPGKYPAVIVLDIMDGAGVVSRGEAMWLATNDVAALVVTMPYYGPRRPAGVKTRLLSPNVDQSVEHVRQTVLDCRRATAWLVAQPEVDASKIGVVGTSLGSFMAGLVCAAEPRVRSACMLLGGGQLVDSFAEHPRVAFMVQALKLAGVTLDSLRKQIAPVDPITYADRLKEKRLLLIAASRDDVVPPIAMKRLWEATGKPKIVWLDSTHVGAAFYSFRAMNAVVDFVKQ
ncbi:alpha/beta hydrolase family protein [Fimbriiglobus ruber]|uniref:Peptidase S9 prolyl oligopeptidase catalytic domain-containing protein n=1 Tax=Fimbriiglobus ruber TaxID=1908690 RepID=A0A225DPC2_9BACT|nr:alpha/beta hydrolase family protein [Fimbriiglobus ruber]OWK38205.1 hypothetical protein FRUB_07325 [Fimbriiglobus ruber]